MKIEILICITLLILLSGCPPSAPAPLPNSLSCGIGSFVVDGNTMTHEGLIPGGLCNPGSVVSYGQTSSEIVAAHISLVKYSAAGLNEFIMNLTVSDANGISIGMPYQADISMPELVTFAYNGGGSQTFTNISLLNNTANGTITFTEIDVSNLVSSGTFSFTGYAESNPSDSILVSNGTFQDIPISVQ